MAKPWHDKDTLKRLCDRGLSQAEVANELGCSQATVCYWMDKYDIQPNNPGGDMTAADTPASYGTYAARDYYETWTDSVDNYVIRVHRLLAVAEYGLDEIKGMDVHHRNGIPWDNRPENIELLTPGEHRSLHGKEKTSGELPEGFGGFTETREWVLEHQEGDNSPSEKQPVEVCFYCQDSVSDPVDSPEGEPCHPDCLEKEQERLAELAGGEWL